MPNKSLSEYYTRWRDDLDRYFRRRVSTPEVAAELTHETFVRLMRVERDATILNPRAWLFRVAHNLVADHHRAGARAPFDQINDIQREAVADPAPSPERHVLSREELDVVSKAIEDLPPRGKQVFMMHRFEGLEYSEIAARLGISRNTVIVHMVRSLAHCKARLNAYRQSGEESL